MPPRTQTRPRSAPARPATRRPAHRRPVKKPRQPLISPDQRRELSGVGLVGLGVLLGVVLALPGGGSIAGPVHDSLLGALGVGAWLIAAGLVLTGSRLLAQRAWTGGALGAAGSVLVVVAMLGPAVASATAGLTSTQGSAWWGAETGPRRRGSAGSLPVDLRRRPTSHPTSARTVRTPIRNRSGPATIDAARRPPHVAHTRLREPTCLPGPRPARAPGRRAPRPGGRRHAAPPGSPALR